MSDLADTPPPQTKLTDSSTFPDQSAFQRRREDLRAQLVAGVTGAAIVECLTDLVDEQLISRYRNLIHHAGQDAVTDVPQCCLVAVGGYGRRELAPHSDIDVMVLSDALSNSQAVLDLSKGLFHHLWDLGFQVGHSVRSIAEALSLAGEDLPAKTALMESRFLAGNSVVFQDFQNRFVRQNLGKRVAQFIQHKLEERQREYSKFGETVFLLEPNIKKSQGGLRDLHLLQWVGMAKYQAATIQELTNCGALARKDAIAIQEAREFLWRIRCLMHFEAGRAQDILTFEDQEQLAKNFGMTDQPHLLAVEQFMQQYYRHTMGLHERCLRFIDRTREFPLWKRLWHSIPSPLLEGYFLKVGDRLTVPSEKLMQVLGNPELLVRLFRLSQERGLPVESQTIDELHDYLEDIPNEEFHIPSVSRIFREILSETGRVAHTLAAMHRAKLLEKLVPAFARVRGLMQFNQYHKYTVDEHSLLAVRQAELLEKDQGPLGTVYAEIKQKDLLHLAVLLHDLGKGKTEDHSEVGKTIAQKTSERLGLTHEESRVLEFLVHKHLLMAHIAFRRDIHDEKVIKKFARAVKTPEVLRQFLILTVADIAAVGPDVMNKWKETLLVELFSHTHATFSGQGDFTLDEQDEREQVQEVERQLHFHGQTHGAGKHNEEFDQQWVQEQLTQFPSRYRLSTSPDRIALHLSAIKRLTLDSPLVETQFHEDLNITEYTLVAYGGNKPGIFMNMTGVLAALGLEVLDAQIVTRKDGIVVDSFSVKDPDYDGRPPSRRLERVCQTAITVLKGEETVEQVFAKGKRVVFGRPYPTGRNETEVQIDNESSDQYTVIEVFADDKQGLLFIIAQALVGLNLSIHSARIGKRLDQAADIFYVTTEGGKIEDQLVCGQIEEAIQKTVDAFLDEIGTSPSAET
ncbi:[protein-PII] uridylyltransferase [Candidatus Nitrospira salsa]